MKILIFSSRPTFPRFLAAAAFITRGLSKQSYQTSQVRCRGDVLFFGCCGQMSAVTVCGDCWSMKEGPYRLCIMMRLFGRNSLSYWMKERPIKIVRARSGPMPVFMGDEFNRKEHTKKIKALKIQ